MYMAIALAIGFALDALIGDPRRIGHPVIWIGRLITRCERTLPRSFGGGAALWLIVCGVSFAVTLAPVLIARHISVWLWLAVEIWFAFRLMAAKSLRDESMAVFRELGRDLQSARRQISYLVSRDTERMSEHEIITAAVETVAENTTDGVVSPLLYFALGGAPLCMLYKAASTLDSMVGYKNEKYLLFGRFSARADDVLNFIPARLAGLLMCLAALFTGANAKNALKIFLRDRRNHASPNSAHTESACAGALGIELGGGASYFGEYRAKPVIGDKTRDTVPDDIRRANALMYVTGVLALVLFAAIRVIIWSVL
ncbi:MAG: adenosylcobinamide-phosphate synthase CbiB [Oscillospiraceae bacterium]|jgi:adenosylcobinamide-phosphate synthase|nr:adenosylcobinamide-phosphate synthase CbiB [Oscillospiraceae bacterium]